jgi:hypothetical protein
MDKFLSKELKINEKKAKFELMRTNLKKKSFINEIKNGLGEEIKKNPNSIRIIQKQRSNVIKRFFNKLFKLF